MTNPLICLSVIVGNEESVIERFIRSFEPAVDFAVFVQAIGTEPEDKTMEIIGRVCEELDLPFVRQIYRNEMAWPHVDSFAAARNQSWGEAAKTGASYLIWADADDLLKGSSADVLRKAAQSGDVDVYMSPYHVRSDKQISWRERMVKNDGCSMWNRPVHETIIFNREVTTQNLHTAILIHAPMPDKRGNSNQRNLRILRRAIEDGGRNLFCIAQESAQVGDRDMFLRAAKAALVHPTTSTLDKYETLLMLAQGELVCETAKGYASRAFDLMPDRREALALLACYALIDGRNEEAYHLAKHLVSIPKPRHGYYSLNHEWYDWKGFYLMTQCLRAVGKHDQADTLEKEQFESNGAVFSICHPTYMRPHQAAAIRDIYLSTARNPMAVEYIFGIHHDDAESLNLLGNYKHAICREEGCGPNFYAAARASTGKFIMCVADDLFPPDGWDEQILAATGDLSKPVALNFSDGLRTDGHMCHGFMTRPWLETILADPWPGTGIYSDNEYTHRARKAGVVIDAPQIRFDHRHFTTGKAPMDATYADQNQQKNYTEGLRLFKERNPDAL